MSNEKLLELGIELIQKLGIKHVLVYKDHIELSYTFDNQKLVAYGNTENEAIIHFYQLYEELFNPAWKSE